MIGIRWILRSLCSLRMTQSGGFVILNKVKNPFGNSLIKQKYYNPQTDDKHSPLLKSS
jgi:hypothetical protein